MDFSDEALYDLYDYASQGIGTVKPDNGYAVGKKMMDVTITMWREDMWITLFPWELYEDGNYPHWWLDKVLGFTEEQRKRFTNCPC